MSPRLRALIPLSVALALITLFIVLLVRQAQELSSAEERSEVETPTEIPPLRGKDQPVPVGPVEAPGQPVEVVRHQRDDGLYRWNLQRYPEGWNPEIALSIHNFFERMTELEQRQKGVPLDDLREEFQEFLASLGPDALPTLAAILDVEPDFVFRRFLLYGIGDLGPEAEEATWILRDYLMARAMNPQSVSESKHVIKAMGRLQNDTSFDALQQLVNDQSVASFRRDLIFQLGEHRRRDEAVGTMVDGLREDGSTANRNKWAQALKKVSNPDTLPDLYHAFEKERYWVTRQTILGAIGGIGDPSSIPFLEEQARHQTQGAVRLSAARALWRIGTRDALAILEDVTASEKDPKLKSHMESWLQESPR